MYLGLDRSSYPGDSVMDSLFHDTNLYYTCFYLAPAPSHGERSWMSTRATLLAQGWGFIPTYVGQQVIGGGSHVVTAAQGVIDADNAATLMQQAGFPVGAVCYLDIENGLQMPPNQVEYVRAWITRMNDQPFFWPGVYCSRKGTATQVHDIAGDIPTWVYGPQRPQPTVPAGAPRPSIVVDPSVETGPDTMTTDFPSAVAWQYFMSLNCTVDLRWTDSSGQIRTLPEVDLNVAIDQDPSYSSDRLAPTTFAKVRDRASSGSNDYSTGEQPNYEIQEIPS